MEKEAIKELILSDGWKILKAKISERRLAAVSALISQRNPEEIFRHQETIKAFDYLLLLPTQILAEVKK